MSDTLTIRLPAGKIARVKKAAVPNVNAWINKLIDQALEGENSKPDWEEHFAWLCQQPKIKGHACDELRKFNR